MNWLNKLDNVLDNAFFRSDGEEGEAEELNDEEDLIPETDYFDENEHQLEEQYLLENLDSLTDVDVDGEQEEGEKGVKDEILKSESGLDNIHTNINMLNRQTDIRLEEPKIVKNMNRDANTALDMSTYMRNADVARAIQVTAPVLVPGTATTSITKSHPIRRPNATTNRPGMILTVLRDDISDSDASSQSSESQHIHSENLVHHQHHSCDEHDATYNLESSDMQATAIDSGINTGTFNKTPTIIVQSHEDSNEPVSPIASPKASKDNFTSTNINHVPASSDEDDYDNDQNQSIDRIEPQTQSLMTQKLPSNISSTQKINKLPPLPLLSHHTGRVQSTTSTVHANNVHCPTASINLNTSKIISNCNNPQPLEDDDIVEHLYNQTCESTTLLVEKVEPPLQNINLKSNDIYNNSNNNECDLDQNKSISPISERLTNNNNTSKLSSSNNSAQTDLIKNTSTISSNFDINDFDVDAFEDDDGFIESMEEEKEEENLKDDERSNDNQHESRSNNKNRIEAIMKQSDEENVKKKTRSTIDILQATMSDYLFSQGASDIISTNDHDENNDYDDDDDEHSNDEAGYESEDEEQELDWEKDDYIIDTHLYSWIGNNEERVINDMSPIQISSTTPTPFDPSFNCHGIVHVKLLRIQHLPVNAGNTVEAIISLPPWKGRIRSQKVTSYVGPSMAGICARWDYKDSDNENDDLHMSPSTETFSQSKIELLSDEQSIVREKSGVECHSMVHTYNNEETPIPHISIEIKYSTLQMFKRDICSFTLSCEPLMRQPNEFRRRWCVADHNSPKSQSKSQKTNNYDEIEENHDDNKSALHPIILIEASFEPTEFGGGNSTSKNSNPVINTTPQLSAQVTNEELSVATRERTDTLECETLASLDSLTNKRLQKKPHLFRVHSDWRPTYCTLCSSMIFRNGYQCEVCKLDCCTDCQLRVDVELPCGSHAAVMAVEQMSKSKLTISKIVSIIAPIKESSEIVDESKPMTVSIPATSTNEEAILRTVVWNDGVGILKLRIIKACLFQRSFPPESELSYILKNSDRWLRRGDYYARVSWTDSKETKRTKAVFQTAKPRFDSDEMLITA